MFIGSSLQNQNINLILFLSLNQNKFNNLREINLILNKDECKDEWMRDGGWVICNDESIEHLAVISVLNLGY
jgi:hypothetical protein